MTLNYRTLGEGYPLIILHGVFGSSDNWQSQGKVLAEHFKVFLVDLRNHGNSFHTAAFDFDLMSQDVLDLMDKEGLTQAHILGHSMGGKVAMHLACRFSDRVKQLIVVDIAPKYYVPHHKQIFDGFRSVQLSKLKSRKEADNQMSDVIPEFGVRQFILKNLHRDKSGNFSWKLNIEAIERNIEKIGSELPKELGFGGPTLFIKGGLSSYILEEDEELISQQFEQYQIKMVPGAGHWVHAEKPAELIDHTLSFLENQ